MAEFFIALAITGAFLAIQCLAFRLGYKVGYGDGYTEKDTIATNECRTCMWGQIQQKRLKHFEMEINND